MAKKVTEFSQAADPPRAGESCPPGWYALVPPRGSTSWPSAREVHLRTAGSGLLISRSRSRTIPDQSFHLI